MSSLRDRRKRAHTKRAHARVAATIIATIRPAAPARSDTHVLYAGPVVSGRRIDRDEWARLVADLIKDETNGNKSQFAARVGTTYKTVNRWLKGEVDASEEMIREVARALRLPPSELLIKVGYYDAAELGPPAPPRTPEEIAGDEALRLIEESDLPPSVRARMRERLLKRRAAQTAAEADEVRWWLDQATGA